MAQQKVDATRVVCGNRDEAQVTYDGSGGELPSHKKKLYAGLSSKRILDIGCGTGMAARFLRDKGNAVSGITASTIEAEIGKSVMEEVYVTDLDAALDLDFGGRAFDAILLGDVLEHLKYPHSMLVWTRSVLSPTGCIYVSIPNVANIDVRLGLLCGKFRYEDSGILDKTHLRFFTIETSRELVCNAGYAIVEESYSNWNWSILPVWLSRLLRLGRAEQMLKDALTGWFPGLLATQVMLIARPVADLAREP